MFWSSLTQRTSVQSIPLYELGTTLDFTLTLNAEDGDNISGAYLFVLDSAHVGLLQAKLSTDETYNSVMGVLDGTCWLGDIADGVSVDIDLRILTNSTAVVGYHIVQLGVGYGDGVVSMPNNIWTDDSSIWFDSADTFWE